MNHLASEEEEQQRKSKFHKSNNKGKGLRSKIRKTIQSIHYANTCIKTAVSQGLAMPLLTGITGDGFSIYITKRLSSKMDIFLRT